MRSTKALNDYIENDLESMSLSPLPTHIHDRQGLSVDVSGQCWKFNVVTRLVSFDWRLLGEIHPCIEYALKRYAMHCIQTESELEAFNKISEPTRLLRKSNTWKDLHKCNDVEELELGLKRSIAETISFLRKEKRIWKFHRLRAAYCFCADFMPELGFDPEYVHELNMIKVSGNPKGEAVRREDDQEGQLTDEEVQSLRNALVTDKSLVRKHVMQRCAVFLGLGFGPNPANCVLLRDGDFEDVVKGDNTEVTEYKLKIPSIKKRGQKQKRHFFREQSIDPGSLHFIQDLISANKRIDTHGLPRPLFMREKPCQRRLGSPTEEYAYHVDSNYINWLLQGFAKRLHIKSHRTGKILRLSARRLRYTFAVEMVRQGVSKNALAKMLDHSDTQSVQVYFDLRKKIVELIDKAAAHKIDFIVDGFQEHVENADSSDASDTKITSGEEEIHINHFDKPYSCYPCKKFIPYSEVHHDQVLGLLRKIPKQKDSNGDGLGLQLEGVMNANYTSH